ncbi:hypothetical protein UXP90_04425 [Enterobacter kobei]
MLRRLCFWALFAVVLLVAWRLAGMLMVIVAALVVCWRIRIKRG